MSELDAVLAHIESDTDAALERLFALLQTPSISTDSSYAADCRSCAEWHVQGLRDIGFSASARDTPGHPIGFCQHSSLSIEFRPQGAEPYRSSGFKDTERNRDSAEAVEAPRGGWNVLAHARSTAQKIPKFVVATTISFG